MRDGQIEPGKRASQIRVFISTLNLPHDKKRKLLLASVLFGLEKFLRFIFFCGTDHRVEYFIFGGPDVQKKKRIVYLMPMYLCRQILEFVGSSESYNKLQGTSWFR